MSADEAVQRAGRLYAERRYEPALELLDQVDASARVGTSYWLARGHVLRELGQRQQAIRAYELGLQFGPDAHISAALAKLRSSEAAGTVETPSGVSATPDQQGPIARPKPPMTDLVLPEADADFRALEERIYKKARAQRRGERRAQPLIFRLLAYAILIVAIGWIAFTVWSVWPDLLAGIADRKR